MEVIYRSRTDNSEVLVSVPVTNKTDATARSVSFVIDSIHDELSITDAYYEVGTYDSGTKTWDGFSLKPDETQVIYLKVAIGDIDRNSLNIEGTITNAVSGVDTSTTSVLIHILKELDLSVSKKYQIILSQSGTSDPTANVLLDELRGTPTLSRVSEGVYRITLNYNFFSNRTFTLLSPVGAPTAVKYELVRSNNSYLTLTTRASNGNVDDLDVSLNIYVEVFND